MPKFDTVIMDAKYPGTDADGTPFGKGARIAYNRRTRRVITADPARIDAIERQQVADAFDMAADDYNASFMR